MHSNPTRGAAVRRRILVPALALTAALAGSALVAAPAQAAGPVTFTGTVSEGGTTLSGVMVDWYSPSTGRFGGVKTAEDGTYSLTVPATAGKFYLAANYDLDSQDEGYGLETDYHFHSVTGAFVGAGDESGYAWQTLAPYSAPTDHAVDIALDHTSTIEVDDIPAGSFVDLYSADGNVYIDGDYLDAAGDYSFHDLFPGTYRVVVEADDFSSHEFVSDPISLGAFAHENVAITTAATATLTGRITSSGKTVAGLPVISIDSDGVVDGFARTNSTGTYTLTGLSAGDHTIETYPYEAGLVDNLGFFLESSIGSSSGTGTGASTSASTRASSAISAAVQQARGVHSARGGVSAAAARSLRSASGAKVGTAIASRLLERSAQRLDKRIVSAGLPAASATSKTGYQPVIHKTQGLTVGTSRTVDLAVRVGGRIDASFTGTSSTTSDLRIVVKSAHYYATYRSNDEDGEGTHGFSISGLPTGTYQIYISDPFGRNYGTKRVTVTSGAIVKASAIGVTHRGLALHVAAPYLTSSAYLLLFNQSTYTYTIGVLGSTHRADLAGILPGTQAAVVLDFSTFDGSVETFSLTKSGSRVLHVKSTPLGKLHAAFTTRGINVGEADAYIEGDIVSGYGWVDDTGRLDVQAPVGDYDLFVSPYAFTFPVNSSYSYAPVRATVVANKLTNLGVVDLPVSDGSVPIR